MVRARVSARLREFYLEEIDAWRRGAKASPGCPASGERYALDMREEVRRLEGLLVELERGAPKKPLKSPGRSPMRTLEGDAR